MTIPAASAAARLPLRRPAAGRVVGGVCRGVAIHLDVRVSLVRWCVVALAVLGGAGVIAYVFLWLTVPEGDPALVARELADPARSRATAVPQAVLRPGTSAAPGPTVPGPAVRGPAVRAANGDGGAGSTTAGLRDRARRVAVPDLAVGALLVVGAFGLVGSRLGWGASAGWVLPTVIVVAGALLAWSQLDGAQRGRLLAHAGGDTRVGMLRLVGGVALACVGVLLLVGQRAQPQDILPAAVAAVAVLVGAALVLAPWWLRILTDLGQERAARERADERAEIAAHLHDSVLQSLALIQRSADRPTDVVRIARTQERELRSWLYKDEPRSGTSVAADLALVTAEVEDMTAVPVETVVVGDASPGEKTEALLRATREALLNAARHGAPPIDVYLEASPQRVEVSVRDHGQGFDLDAVAPDRLGVRESIIGRVTRHGGTAIVRRPPSGGTEVRMVMPLGFSDERTETFPQEADHDRR